MLIMKRDTEYYFVLITFITSFFSVFIVNGVILGVPTIGAEFGMNNVVQNWIPTILVFVVTIFTLPAGQICGKFGFRRSLIYGQAIILLGLAICCLSVSTEMFFASRVIQGIGIAIGNVCEMAIVVLAIKEENRGKALGIIVTGVYLGTTLSPAICGFLVQNFGWRSMFYITIFFNTIGLIILILKIKDEWKTNENDKIDFKGMILYMVGIFFLIYGITTFITIYGKLCTLIGIVLLIVFGLFELRVKTPSFDVNLFKVKPFTAYNIAGIFGYLAIMSLTTILNYHFQYVRGWNPQLTGFILLVSPIVMSITAPFAGRLSDKVQPQRIASVGMVLAAFGFVFLIYLNGNTSLYIIILAMILAAAGMGLFSSPNMNAIMSSVEKKYAAHASAAQLTMRGIGQTVSLSLLTLVFAWIMGKLPLSAKYATLIVQASQIFCLICCISCVLAVVFSIVGLKAENKISN